MATKPKYKFSHRAGGFYYWTRRAPEFGPAYEEQITVSTLYFWDQITDDDSLPHCDCKKSGTWGATGMMPDDRHCLVVTKTSQYLAHVPDCASRGPRIGEGMPVCRRPKGHKGLHRANPEDGWGSNSTWGLRMEDGSYL